MLQRNIRKGALSFSLRAFVLEVVRTRAGRAGRDFDEVCTLLVFLADVLYFCQNPVHDCNHASDA